MEIRRHILPNGLRVVAHRIPGVPMATFNLLYKVGSRNEDSRRTGLAHLMEHLMFSGSENAKDFDEELQSAGGENNAFTDEDLTNYYEILPVKNLETAFWLESDRMNNLSLSEESIEVQRKVVMEEFRQRCLNVPYGDLGHLRSGLVFKEHPYRWPVIGLELNHIADASYEEIMKFYRDHYAPDNAVLAVVGDIEPDEVFRLAEKWFADIKTSAVRKKIVAEPKQTERRELSVTRDVPGDVISMAYHMPGRLSREYYVLDTVTDIMADGTSSRLVKALTRDNPIFSEVDSGVSATLDPGILSFSGTLLPGVTMEQAERCINEVTKKIIDEGVGEYELQKVKNRHEAYHTLKSMMSNVVARDLAYYESLGDANMLNDEDATYESITSDEIRSVLAETLRPENGSVIYYHAQKANS